ncbi:MAG: prepilin peptidase [Gemmatimonadaceae bacterium]|nr:prepilin peptidase [Gemmatimonadaceae bacterium]MCW5825688.1 prepilin peptidase [Gemmatimonadaceae bacterium]
MTPLILALWATIFFLGASLGSFLNVCISRWPAELSVVAPRSRCPRCERPIAWYDNIPIVSWLLLRAKCRGCGLPISAQYPLIELAVGVIWVLAVWHFGLSLTAARIAIAATILLGVVMTDLQHYVIPDGFTLTGFALGLLLPLVALAVGEQGPFAGPWDAVIGACAGAGLIAIVGWLGEIALGKEAMGQGDVTLMAMLGAMVGPERSILTIFLAAGIGAVAFLGLVLPIGWWRARRAGTAFETPLVPFGVFLAPAGMVALLWGDALLRSYLNFVGL